MEQSGSKVNYYVKFSLNSSKKEGIRISILMKYGHNHTLTHRTTLTGSKKDLERINFNGTLKENTKSETARLLHQKIRKEIDSCKKVIDEIVDNNISLDDLNSETFEECFNNGVTKTAVGVTKTLKQEFLDFIVVKKKELSAVRIVHYKILFDVFERFLKINCIEDIIPSDFTEDHASAFNDFYINEYEYTQEYSYLYENKAKRNIPSAPRSNNTTAVKIKQMKSFFAYMLEKGIVTKNVFKPVKSSEKYDTDKIFSLTLEELRRIKNTDVPTGLQQTKDAFLFQCYTGQRINEFVSLSKRNVLVSSEGIPYIYYKASKTEDVRKTSLVRTAFDILIKNDFTFPILKNISGCRGYNKKIKELLQFCEINRMIVFIDEETGLPTSKPIYELVSNKHARKTRVDMFPKQLVNNMKYSSGLHSKGSDAVNHYTNIDTDVKSDFTLSNLVFQEQEYKVDSNFNVIE